LLGAVEQAAAAFVKRALARPHLLSFGFSVATSYVDGPYWQALFDVSNELVCFGHMSGLLVRVYDRWP
jgi:hypothetical protein